MDFFRKNTTPKIVEKHTTFNYSRKTPKQIIEERENKKLNVLFNKINENRTHINNNCKLNNKSFNSSSFNRWLHNTC